MTKRYKVKIKEDFKLFGRFYYAGYELEVSEDVYEKIKDKVEVIEEVEENADSI